MKASDHNGFFKRVQLILIAVLLFLTFLIFFSLLSYCLQDFGDRFVNNFFTKVSSPLLGLFLGIIFTAVVQSSSLVTTSVVALVSSGTLMVPQAISIILGANIGTCFTSTILSFGFISDKKEYRRAVAAGTVHDFFNIIGVIILLPLEYFFQILSKPAFFIAENIKVEGFGEQWRFLKSFNLDLYKYLDELFNQQTFIIAILSIIGLYASIKLFSKLTGVLKSFEDVSLKTGLLNHNFKSFLSGMGLTILVRSSTITTSLIVPFVAKRQVKLQKAFYFIVGCNIGTTLTAIVAGLASRGAIGFAIAMVHFLFNCFTAVLLSLHPKLRLIPIILAKKMGDLVYKNRLYAVAYTMLVFFVLPILLYSFLS